MWPMSEAAAVLMDRSLRGTPSTLACLPAMFARRASIDWPSSGQAECKASAVGGSIFPD